MNTGDVVYACVVSDCWERWVDSIHSTKAGAWRAGRVWLLKKYEQEREARDLLGRHNDTHELRNFDQFFFVKKMSVV